MFIELWFENNVCNRSFLETCKLWCPTFLVNFDAISQSFDLTFKAPRVAAATTTSSYTTTTTTTRAIKPPYCKTILKIHNIYLRNMPAAKWPVSFNANISCGLTLNKRRSQIANFRPPDGEKDQSQGQKHEPQRLFLQKKKKNAYTHKNRRQSYI